MNFYEKYELLCQEQGMKPQNAELLDILGVTSPTVTGWKRGSMPKSEVLIKLSQHFNVSTDWLLNLSTVRKHSDVEISSNFEPMEDILLKAYRSSTELGKAKIIQICMNELDNAESKKGSAIS